MIPKVVMLEENLSNVSFVGRSFKGQDLVKKVMRFSKFECCDFDEVDLTEADCTGSSFAGCTFRRTVCYQTNFKDCVFGGAIFEPKDLYGATFTMTCKTFQNMHISQQWWYAWLLFGTQMVPSDTPNKNCREMLIGMIGAERFTKLKALFAGRDC